MSKSFEIYKGENRDGKKCMKCTICKEIQEHVLWYTKKNRHYCPFCHEWTTMVNLDNEEFNPSRR